MRIAKCPVSLKAAASCPFTSHNFAVFFFNPVLNNLNETTHHIAILNIVIKMVWFSVTYPMGQLLTSRSATFGFARKWRQVKESHLFLLISFTLSFVEIYKWSLKILLVLFGLSDKYSNVTERFLSAETGQKSNGTLSGGDFKQLLHTSGSQHRTTVCCPFPSRPTVPGPTGGHLPQPERLHFFQVPQVRVECKL